MSDPTATARAFLTLRADDRAVTVAEWRAQTGDVPDIATAYAVQDAMVASLRDAGHRPIGYKIGATNAPARAMLGVGEPFYGVLFDTHTRPSPAKLDFVPAIHRVLEPEIALVMGRDLGPEDGPHDAESIRAATRAVLPAIEIIATSIAPWTEAGGTNLIADNGAHGLWITGEPLRDWSAFDLLESPVSVAVNGETTIGRGSAVEGGPFAATAWLANTLNAQGKTLRSGDRVTTGSVIPPVALEPGQSIIADYGPLGAVSLSVSH